MNNLKNLIQKDLLLHKKFILWMAPLYPLYLGFFGSRINSTTLLSIFSGFLYSIVPLTIFSREDKFKTDTFNLSLPVTRREIVGARYILSWGLILLMFAAGSLVAIVMPGSKLAAAVVFSPRMILLSLAFMSLIFGILMPFFVRLGMAGLMVFVVVMQVLGILLMILRKAIPIETVKALFLLIPKAISALQSSFGPFLSFLAILAVLGLFSYASFAVSLAFFRRKGF